VALRATLERLPAQAMIAVGEEGYLPVITSPNAVLG